ISLLCPYTTLFRSAMAIEVNRPGLGLWRCRLLAWHGAFFGWHFLFRCDFVFRFGNSHQPVVEPANNILQPLDAMPRLTRARKLVRFIGKTHHHRRNLAKFERTKHFLAAGSRRRSEIAFAQD